MRGKVVSCCNSGVWMKSAALVRKNRSSASNVVMSGCMLQSGFMFATVPYGASVDAASLVNIMRQVRSTSASILGESVCKVKLVSVLSVTHKRSMPTGTGRAS